MHFGEFNPLEVLAAAAVQRGGNVAEGSTSNSSSNVEETTEENNDEKTDDVNSSKEQETKQSLEKNNSKSDAKKEEKNEKGKYNIITTVSSSEVITKELKQLSVLTADGNVKGEPGAPSYVIKMVTSNGNKVTTTRSVMSLKDATKIVIPNKDGSSKTLTVLKINKTLGNKSNVTAGVITERPKGEDDEGYCSRSSLDSPGQCSRSDSELCEHDTSDIKSPGGSVVAPGKGIISPTSVKMLTPRSDQNSESMKSPVHSRKMVLSPSLIEAGKKPAKIVIVSKDSSIKTIVTDKEDVSTESKFSKPTDPVNVSQNGNHGAVLRSLLGEKSTIQVSEKPPLILSAANAKLSLTKAVSSCSDSPVVKSQTDSALSNMTVNPLAMVQTENEKNKVHKNNISQSDTEKDNGNKTVDNESLDISGACGSRNSGTLTQGKCIPCSDHSEEKTIDSVTQSKTICVESTDSKETESRSKNDNCDIEKMDIKVDSNVDVLSTNNEDAKTESSVVRVDNTNKTVNTPGESSSENKNVSLVNIANENIQLDNTNIDVENVSDSSPVKEKTDVGCEGNSDNSKNPLKRSESFQNAFQSFLTSGKPVEVTEIKGTTVLSSKSDGSAILLPQNVLASLNSTQGGKITVVAGCPASQLVTSLASQVLATSQSLQLAQPSSHVTSTPKALVTKEGIIDIGSHTKESLKLASSNNAQSTSSISATSNTNNLTVNSIIGNKGNTVTKTIPVLINTANGKRIANVPVTSLVSTNPSNVSNKPVTYLVMPPQGKGASLLLPPPFNKPQPPPVPKYQYIIQDDVPPVVSTATSQPPTVNIVNMAKSALVPKSDTWTLLATVEPQGMVVAGVSQSKSKTVPVLIKKPLLSNPNTTVVPQNSVLVSSKGPQSLIPRLVAPQLAANLTNISQDSRLTGRMSNLKGENRLVNPNEVLRTQALPQKDSILDLGHVGKKSNVTSLASTGSHSHISEYLEDLNDSQLTHIKQSSQNSEDTDQSDLVGEVFLGESSGLHKTDKSRSKTPINCGSHPSGNGRITPLHSLETSPSENTINIKITGSKVIDMRTSEDLTMSTKKAATSIGKFGALSTSWGGFQKSDSVPNFAGTSLASGTSSPIYDSATSPSSSVEPWSPNPMSPLQIKSDSELDVESVTRPRPKIFVESNRSGHNYCRRKLRGSTSSTPDLTTIKDGINPVSRLHPLIDHDYCMFSEFSADIQSSIIATTESKKKIEKYNQKAKAARTTKESLFKLDKNSIKMKKRKYNRLPVEEVRRMRQDKALERQIGQHKSDLDSNVLLETSQVGGTKVTKSDKSGTKKQAALDKKLLKPRISKRRDGRNYVKITGSFQDDFVYYATKNSRGRPRKYHDATTPKPQTVVASTKKPPVGGINVFDWYRDLSKTDKSSKFGVPESPVEVKVTKADPYINGIDENLDIQSVLPKGGQTPMHESEVADLVMQMMPSDEYNAASSEFSIPANPSVAQSETVVTSGNKDDKKKFDSGAGSGATNTSSETAVDLNDMAEQVRSLLNSLGEAELNMLTEKLSTSELPNSTQSENESKESTENVDSSTETENGSSQNPTDGSDYAGLNVFLGPYNPDNGPTIPQGGNASFDLDDINDNDLLPTDISNINTLLGDLGGGKTCTSEAVSSSDPKYTQSTLDSPVKNNVSLSLLFGESPGKSTDSNNTMQSLDKSGFAVPNTGVFKKEKVVCDSNSGQRPPELTVVSMYWNDLPGLMINGKQCVRLVDIHKQMLPAKDTGILKKRCQMMNLEIMNCSELERDFLIRYANAAKSKSCVIVAKDDAQDLVSFYVNPRPRISSAARQSTSDSRESSAERLNDSSLQNGTSSALNNNIEVDSNAPPKSTAGKGKGKSRPASVSSDRASTPSGGKGKGGGKSHKRKVSPLSPTIIPPNVNATVVHNTSPTVITVHSTASPSSVEPSVQFQDSSIIKRSERTRNRKVNYAALNSGLYSDENPEVVSGQLNLIESPQIETSSTESTEKRILGPSSNKEHKPSNNPQKTLKMGRSLLNKVVLIKNSPVLKSNGMNSVTVDHVQGEPSAQNHYNFQEEIEIRRLRNKQKRRGLNNAEKKKLKRLRERLRLKVKNLKRKIDTLKKNNGLALSPKKILIKSMKDAQARQKAVLQQTVPGIEQLSDSSCVENEGAEIEGQKMDTVSEMDSSSSNITVFPNSVVNENIKEGTVVIQSESSVNKVEAKQENLPVSSPNIKQSISQNMSEQVNKFKVKEEVTPKVKTENISRRTEMSLRTPNRKVIFPVLHRSNQRGRVQVGNLHFHMYRTRDSSCIQCTTCSDFLSVKKFLKHLHHQNIADELCTVTIPQKLEMAVLEPSEEQVYWWSEFEKKRDLLEVSSYTPKPSQRTSRLTESKDCNTGRKETVLSKTGNLNNNTVTSLSQGLTTPTRVNPVRTSLESVSGTRQSTRTRKRKQLHPIESYVYTSKSGQQNDTKRIKLEEEPIVLNPVTPVTPLSTMDIPESEAAVVLKNNESNLSLEENLIKGATNVPSDVSCNNNSEIVTENSICTKGKALVEGSSITFR